jgi:hypothetical protein
LAAVTGLPQSKTNRALRVCSHFLTGHQPEGPFQIYHASFSEFLRSDEQYQVYPGEAHQNIAGFFLGEYSKRWPACEEAYALKYLPSHLAEGAKTAVTNTTT